MLLVVVAVAAAYPHIPDDIRFKDEQSESPSSVDRMREGERRDRIDMDDRNVNSRRQRDLDEELSVDEPVPRVDQEVEETKHKKYGGYRKYHGYKHYGHGYGYGYGGELARFKASLKSLHSTHVILNSLCL